MGLAAGNQREARLSLPLRRIEMNVSCNVGGSKCGAIENQQYRRFVSKAISRQATGGRVV